MFNVNDEEEIGRGSHGIVYMCYDGKTCCKKIFNNIKYTEKTLRKIKKLQIHNIYKIYEIRQKGSFLNRELDEYYMDYYEPAKITNPEVKKMNRTNNNLPLLYFPIEYIIRNYYALKDTFEQLYKHNIEVIDMRYLNLVFTEKDIIIIDVDNYKKFNPINKLLGIQKVHDIDHFFYILLHEEISYGFMGNEISLEDYREFMSSINEKFIDKLDGYANLHDFLLDNIKKKDRYNRKRLLK